MLDVSPPPLPRCRCHLRLQPLLLEDRADGIRRMKEMSLGKVSEGSTLGQGDLEAGRARLHSRAASPGSPPPESSASGQTAGSPGPTLSAAQWFAREERKAIDAYVQDRELEVVVILEGTDTSTGSTVQVFALLWRAFEGAALWCFAADRRPLPILPPDVMYPGPSTSGLPFASGARSINGSEMAYDCERKCVYGSRCSNVAEGICLWEERCLRACWFWAPFCGRFGCVVRVFVFL